MSVIRVGSTSKYAAGWVAVFGGKAAKKSSAKGTKKLAAKKSRPAKRKKRR